MISLTFDSSFQSHPCFGATSGPADRLLNMRIATLRLVAAVAFACVPVGCAALPGGASRGGDAKAKDPGPEGDIIACYQAELVYLSREDKPDVGWTVLGYSSLDGPVGCPDELGGVTLATPIHAAGHLITANEGETWNRIEQDRTKASEIALVRYDYKSYKIVFAEKTRRKDLALYSQDEWAATEALGVRPPEHEILIGDKPRVQSFNQWIEDLGAARPVFERFYQRRNLFARQNRDDRIWAERNVYSCFESIGKQNLCSAESSGQMHPTNQPHNWLPEAWYCAGYGHLNHDPVGHCHTAGDVNSPYAQCMFGCLEKETRCVELTGDRAQCSAKKLRCTKRC